MSKINNYPELNPEKIYEAIRQGTYDAIWQMINNATDAPCADFFDSIKEGARLAVSERLA
jgi:hypothetical protein